MSKVCLVVFSPSLVESMHCREKKKKGGFNTTTRSFIQKTFMYCLVYFSHGVKHLQENTK